LVKAGKLYRRYELKSGKEAPEGFEAAQYPDEMTGDIPGWIPVGDGPEDKYHREALDNFMMETRGIFPPDHTYELVGPKVQSNPYHLKRHEIWQHGFDRFVNVQDRSFEGLRDFLTRHYVEGLVFYNDDGRMCKIKRRDYGIAWPEEGK
jgi:hypothetical protein